MPPHRLAAPPRGPRIPPPAPPPPPPPAPPGGPAGPGCPPPPPPTPRVLPGRRGAGSSFPPPACANALPAPPSRRFSRNTPCQAAAGSVLYSGCVFEEDAARGLPEGLGSKVFEKKLLTGWQREGKVSPCAARPEGRRRGPPEGEARTLKTGYCEMNRIERCPPGEPSPPKGRGSRRKPRSNGCGSDAALFKRRV